MRDRLIELLKEGSNKAGEHLREVTKKVLAEKGSFNSKTDCDRRNMYEIEADCLLANGVIVPPCKIGDKVYVITRVSNAIIELVVIGMWACDKNCSIITDSGNIISDSFGKTVFLTKEEAEKALQRKEDEGK